MADLNVTLRITANASGVLSTVQQIAGETRKMGVAAGSTATEFNVAGKAAAGFTAEVDRLKSGAVRLALAFGGLATIKSVAASIVTTSNAIRGQQQALLAATGSQQAAAEAMAFARGEAQRLGTEVISSTGAFVSLTAAARGTALEGQATQKIFTAVSEAARVLNLSTADTEGALNALQQMISKGTVQAEELRGQLGERLPGAFSLAAEAMGVTTAQLGDLLQAGKVTADELLPKLAERLHELYGAAAQSAAQSPAAEMNRLRNAVTDLEAAIGNAGFMTSLAGGAVTLAQALRGLVDSGAIDRIVAALGALAVVAAASVFSRLAQSAVGYLVNLRQTAAAQSAYAEMVVTTDLRITASSQARAATEAANALQTARTQEAMLLARQNDARANVAALAEVRALAVAKAQLAAVDLASMQRQLAAASATQTTGHTLRLRAEATEAAAAATVRINVLTEEFARLSAIAAGTTARLTAAEVDYAVGQNAAAAATARQTAALAASTAAQAALAANTAANAERVGLLAGAWNSAKTAGASLFSLMGGWVTVAIGATYGVYALVASIMEANRAEAARIKEFAAGITTLRESTRATEELTAARAAQAAGAAQPVADVYAQEAKNLELIAQKTDELAKARERLRQAILGADVARAMAGLPGNLVSAKVREAQQEVAALTASISRLRDATADYTGPTTARLLAFLSSDLPNAAKDAKQAMNGVFAAMRGGDVAGSISALMGSFGQVMDQVRARFMEADKAGKAAFDALAKGAADSSVELDKFGKSQAQVVKGIADAHVAALIASKADEATIKDAREKNAAWVANVAALEAKQKAMRGATQADNEAAQAAKALANANAGMAREWIEQAGAVDEASEAISDFQLSVLDALDTMRERIKTGVDAAEAERLYAGAVAIAAGALHDKQAAQALATEANRQALNVVDGVLASLERERDLVGMTAREREIANLILDAETAKKAAAKAAGVEYIGMTEAEIAAIRARAGAAIDTIDAVEAAGRAAEETSQAGARAWTDFAGDLVDAMGRGMRGVKDLFKNMLLDLVRQLLQSRILRLMASVFGGSMPGLAMAAGAGGQQSMLGAMLGQGAGGLGALAGGITQGGGLLGGMLSGTFGAAGGMLAGLGGAAAAFGGGLTVAGSAGLLAAGQFGVASLAAGNLAVGLGALIPVIGVIAGAAMAINSLSGGRLFGTSYQATSGTTSLSLGADGGAASQSISEARQRALFGGRQSRTRSIAASDEAVQAAQQLYDSVRAVMVNSAQALRGDAPAMLDAAIRTVVEYDKKGKIKATKIFVDILGRTWEEATAEAATQRVAAEAMIATIDAILGTTVDAATQASADAAADVVTGAAAGAAGVFGTIGDMLVKSAAGAQGEASAIAERWRGDAAMLADGAAMLLAAAVDIRSGNALLGDGGTLTQIADLITGLQAPGEALAATYARVAASTALLDEALGMTGVNLGKTREEIVRFAVDIAEAAGGLDRATQLWSNYFQMFYAEAERLQFAITRATSNAQGQFGDIGLSLSDYTGDTGAADFRALFESVMPTLSAEAYVQWLEAAEALGILIDLSAQAGDAIGGVNTALSTFMADIDAQIAEFAPPQTFAERMSAITTSTADLITRATALGASEEELARIRELGTLRYGEVLAEQASAMERYTDIVRGVRDELADAQGLSEYQRDMREVNRWLAETIASMNEAARAAGLQGAAEMDLAAAHELAAIRAAAAIARLQERGRNVVEQLYGTPLEQLNEQIALIESGIGNFAGSVSSGMGEVEQATNAAVSAQLGAQQRIRDWLDNLMMGDLGGLRPRDALVEAQALFDRTLAAALGGDAEAMGALPGLADQLLRLGQQVYASGSPYFDLRDSIREALLQVANIAVDAGLPAGGNGGNLGGGGGGPMFDGSGANGAAGLYAEREQLLAEQAAAQRRELALELAGIIRDLVIATGSPLAEIADQLGVSMTALIADLGINLDNLTVGTASQLADVAQAMGVNLSELAANVGVDLGTLADRQSLLNDALESEIAGLPAGQRDLLQPLLRDIEDAAALGDTAGVETGIGLMEDAINEMAPDLRDLLQPYFLGVVPASPATTESLLGELGLKSDAMVSELVWHTGLLQTIADNTAGGLIPGGNLTTPFGTGGPPPSFAVGTSYVQRDGLAYIHEGEAVIPATVNSWLRSAYNWRPPTYTKPGPNPGPGAGRTDDAVVQELRRIGAQRTANDDAAARLERRVGQLEQTIARAIDEHRRAVERNTDEQKRRQ